VKLYISSSSNSLKRRNTAPSPHVDFDSSPIREPYLPSQRLPDYISLHMLCCGIAVYTLPDRCQHIPHNESTRKA